MNPRVLVHKQTMENFAIEQIEKLSKECDGRIYPESAFKNALKDMIKKQRSLKRRVSIISIFENLK